MEGKMSMERITRIVLILVMIVLLICIYIKLKERYSAEKESFSDSEQTVLGSSVSDTDEFASAISDKPNPDTNTGADEIFKDVLLGDAQFRYPSDGKIGTITIADVPSLFDADDPFMKIWQFAIDDLNGDGEDEVILFVVGAAGDTGGKVILHQAGDMVYGYITDDRTLVDLKTDGTYNFSDPTGVTEAGIAAITAFSEIGYTVDKISYETGTYEGWNTFVVDHQPATEEEYLDAVSRQDKKQNAECYDFNDENINTLF
ncbi:MAG: hypothetical protein NC121_01790 [Blautia sp.]|nr:hypothetical protein [Blautia sp.]